MASVRVERTGSNTSGDLMRLLPWLANEGAARTDGLKTGRLDYDGKLDRTVRRRLRGRVWMWSFRRAGKVHLRFA